METSEDPLLQAQPAAPIEQTENVRESCRREPSYVQKIMVLSMTFGPGSAVATYTTLFGWYQRAYHSREVLIWMRIALFTPFPIITVLQQRYDALFDERFSTSVAYFFRVISMQVAVAVLMVVWMFLPLRASVFVPIVSFGVLLGACCAPFIGSAVQIAVALDDVLQIWAQLGNTLGMTVPVFSALALGFTPSSSHADLRDFLVVPMVICLFAAVWLALLYRSGMLSRAFVVIAERRASRMSQASPQLHGDAVNTIIESESTSSTNNRALGQDQVPHWVWYWLSLQTTGITSDFFLLTLIGYFGDPLVTQNLSLGALVASASGRILAIQLRYVPGFSNGPMHVFGGSLFIVRMGLWLIATLKFAKVFETSAICFFVIWCTYITLSMLHNSLTDVTITANVPVTRKQDLAQYGIICQYSGVVLGMTLASTLALSHDALPSRA